MDPTLDPLAVTSSPSAAANVFPIAHNHPPYAEMISAAIEALNEQDGSSKRAIANYIETQYSDLPPNHSDLLTHHLKQLKTNGQLLMVKHSYKLPGARSAPSAVNGAVAVESADPGSSVVKRRPGRPPKLKPGTVQAAVPVFPPPLDMNDVPAVAPAAQPSENVAVPPEDAYIAASPVNGILASPVRGRGRPPKRGGAKRGRGRPPKISGGGEVARSRGMPKKNDTPIAVSSATSPLKGSGRPRGRPPKPINVVQSGVPAGVIAAVTEPVDITPPSVAPLSGKRRGRPSKAGNEAKKGRFMNAALPKPPRKLSGRPLGRPRKNFEEPANRTTDSSGSQLLVAYLELKVKLENLQTKVVQTVTLIRPSLHGGAEIHALQELELLAVNAGAPPDASQFQQQQPLPEQAKPQS